MNGMLRHGEGACGGGWGKGSLQLKKTERVGGVLTSFISKKRQHHYYLKMLLIISSYSVFISLSIFIERNFNIFKNNNKKQHWTCF